MHISSVIVLCLRRLRFMICDGIVCEFRSCFRMCMFIMRRFVFALSRYMIDKRG